MNEDKFFELAEMAVKVLADIEKRLEEVEKRLEQASKPKMGGGTYIQNCSCASKHIHLGAGDPQNGGYGN